MGRNKAKHERNEEQEEKETPDNDLEWSDDEDSQKSFDSAATASIHDGIEILKLLADYGYDVKGKLAEGNMQFLFRSKSIKTQGLKDEQPDGNDYYPARYEKGASRSRNEYRGRAPAPPAYNEPHFQDDRSVKSKKRDSKHNGLASWMRT